MKINPSSREQFKTNKISPHSFNTEVNESEIHASSLEQVQQLINEDTDLVFDALVAADYIDEIDCLDSTSSSSATRSSQHRRARTNHRHSIPNICKQ